MPAIVHIIVFTNFEGPIALQQAQAAVNWFDACRKAHYDIRWTHLYTPYLLLVNGDDVAAAENVLSPYLLGLQDSGSAEIGMHMHMHYDFIRATGVDAVGAPFAGDGSDACNSLRKPEDDRSGLNGYDVLMTGYSPADRSAILDASITAFLSRGFHRPRTFCAGYSAADPLLQAMLADKGFTASLSAQPVSPFAPRANNYPECWHQLLAWSGHITPLTMPYRVNRHSILPPPHEHAEYLELVEAPLNMWVDKFGLYMEKDRVSRSDMFDCHFKWSRETGNETAVAIGVHADIVAGETWGEGEVFRVIDGFLRHVKQRALEAGVEIAYGTASEVAKRFWENKHTGHVTAV